MKQGHVGPWIAEYLAGTLPPDRRSDVESHLGGCPACRAELDNVLLVQNQARESAREAPPASPFLWTRISAHRNGTPVRKGLLPGWASGGLLAMAVLVLLVVFLPVSGTSDVAIDLSALQDYALANPDLVLSFVETPNEENSYSIFEGLYYYSEENGLSLDSEGLKEHYKYFVSNVDEFI